MKRLFRILFPAAFVLALSGCKVEDTIHINLPMGVRSISAGLAVQYAEGQTTVTGEVPGAATSILTIDNDQLFNTLKYYKNDEITSLTIKNVTLSLTRMVQAAGEEVRDLLIEAYVDEEKIDEYYNPVIDVFGTQITGDGDLAGFMEHIISEAVAGKSVVLKYSGTYITTDVFTGARTAFGVTIGQEMDAMVTVRR